MGTFAAIGLLVLGIAQGVISLYFVTLLRSGPNRLGNALGRVVYTCGIDGGSCRRVASTPHARLAGGIPNAVIGVAWSLLVLGCTTTYFVTDTFPLWWLCIAGAAASLIGGVYLSWVLFTKLREPCPL